MAKGKNGPLNTPMAPFAYKGKTPSLEGSGVVVKNITPGKSAPISSPLNGKVQVKK